MCTYIEIKHDIHLIGVGEHILAFVAKCRLVTFINLVNLTCNIALTALGIADMLPVLLALHLIPFWSSRGLLRFSNKYIFPEIKMHKGHIKAFLGITS